MSLPTGDSTWAERCYRALLRLYPRRFRERFGAGMRHTFFREHSGARARGARIYLWFWIVTFAHAIGFGSSARLAGLSSGLRRNLPSRDPGSRFRWSLPTDVRFALRLLIRSPVFTLTAVLSLAIGIAASTTIFGFADAVLFQASPGVRDPGRVVDVGRTTDDGGHDTMSYPAFEYLRDRTQTLAGMAALTTNPTVLSMSEGAGGERVYGSTVSADFFEVLGVGASLGRVFRPDEGDIDDPRPVVVLSHRFWQERFDADPAVLERSVRLNRTDFEIIGVAEAGFDGATLLAADIWIPIPMVATVRGAWSGDALRSSRSTWLVAIGRLQQGVTRESARAELNALIQGFNAERPEAPQSHGIAVASTGRVPVGFRLPFGAFVGLLFVMTAGLLAIAGSNVAGMLLARATVRRREMATRLAVGASRGQLIGQMLIETLVLFAAAGLVALLMTFWLSGAIEALLPSLPAAVQFDLTISPRAALFAAGISLLAGIVFGMAPARHALRTDLSRALHGRTSTASRRRLRLRHGLVIAQVALSIAMVVTAGLFVRTLREAAQIDPGFRTNNVALISIDTTSADAQGEEAVALANRVADGLRSVRGVEAVGYSRMIPLQGSTFGLGGARVPGLSEADSAFLDDAHWDLASPDYFRAVGLPIVAGRAFSPEDRDGQPLVAIVNETFAQTAWPGESAIGRRFWQTDGADDEGRPIEIVGVAGNARYRTINEAARAFIYVPFAQQPGTRAQLYVRHGEGQAPASDLRAAVRAAEPGLPIVYMQTFREATALGLLPQRLAAWIAGVVGAVGVFLAMLGLYGLTAFLVTQRTREIAIRMALGASQADVRTMVLRQAAVLGGGGALVGVVLASGLGLAVQSLSLLVNVPPVDPVTFSGVALLMMAVLGAASYLPARRAVATDPATALRTE